MRVGVNIDIFIFNNRRVHTFDYVWLKKSKKMALFMTKWQGILVKMFEYAKIILGASASQCANTEQTRKTSKLLRSCFQRKTANL